MSFRQLLDYLDKEEVLERFTHNLYASRDNKRELTKEFMQNAKYLQNSRGKLYLYHEVLSLENAKLSPKQIQTILEDLAREYLE